MLLTSRRAQDRRPALPQQRTVQPNVLVPQLRNSFPYYLRNMQQPTTSGQGSATSLQDPYLLMPLASRENPTSPQI